MHRSLRRALASLALCGLSVPAAAVDLEKVTFASAPILPTQVEQQLARERGLTAAAQPGDPVDGFLARPAGPGPFSAVVALHGCNGLTELYRKRWAERIVGWGHVALIVDSFAHHPVKQACNANRAASRAARRPLDAQGALTFLATQPFVDPRRVGLVGHSQGGWAALDLVQTRASPIVDPATAHRYAAIVAWYPGCASYFDAVNAPTLILIGEADDWTRASLCRAMVESRAGRGAALDLVTYPDAHHGFDWPELDPPRTLDGFTLKYDAAAAADSMRRAESFFARHLAR
ncbi:MAG: dienelactone hydrolase family protein [Alphaproteobacteria bacterium]|nr:dienelactone hydrolase family protein [Alphaproteobacteria bacterium]